MTKDDLISRQAAIDALGERPMVWTEEDQYTLGARNQYDRDRLAIGTLPPAEVTLCHLGSPCEYQNADIVMPSAQPERTCVNCGRTANNGGWYADGRTRCPIEEHYALPKDGYCHLWEKRRTDG